MFCKDHDVKIVTTLHGTDITVLGIDQTFKKVIKHGIEKSDAVTAVSKSLVKQTTEMLDVNKEIATIYNFVNEEDYYKQDVPALRQQYGISNDEKVLIHISNFRKVKRVRDIIYAFKQVRNEVKSTLLLVGDGPEYPDTVQLVEALGLKEHVRFLGKQTNISELLSISNLMLLLSEKESFGLVLLEAMLCGVPCIGTNIGGIPEVIEHDKTGYLVELGDTDSAANYAIEVLTDNHLMRRLSENALIQAKEKFASEKIVNQYQHLYDTVLTSIIENGD